MDSGQSLLCGFVLWSKSPSQPAVGCDSRVHFDRLLALTVLLDGVLSLPSGYPSWAPSTAIGASNSVLDLR
jgi:hypothetical protein